MPLTCLKLSNSQPTHTSLPNTCIMHAHVIDTHAHKTAAGAVSAFSQGIAEISQSSPPHKAAKVRRALAHTRAYIEKMMTQQKEFTCCFFFFMYLVLRVVAAEDPVPALGILWALLSLAMAALSLCHCLSFVATIEIIAQ